jgi:2-polyprenyl-3-methyl-5-hydroxy-6-metoxy-1,4-benzoquinol methylase
MTFAQIKDNFSNQTDGYHSLFTQKQVPVFQNKVYPTQSEALQAEIGEVELVQSTISGFVYNLKFDNSLMNYDANYQNEQATSLFFQQHLQKVLAQLESYGLEGKKVVEIGCGKGHFFDMMQNKHIDCIGFDPTYEGNNPLIRKEYFTESSAIQGDVIILRHTLEHITSPFSFLHQIAKANNYRGKLFVEVPTFDWILHKQAFWDIFYEHCNYFTESSLGCMFTKAEVGNFFGGQYIYLWADLADLQTTIPNQASAVYQPLFVDTIVKWTNFLDSHQNIAIWGAGAKGSTFLNLLDSKRQKVACVVDINPVKQGKYIAKTGHPIVSPNALERQNIENILVMNENYLSEIQVLTKELNIKLFTL